MAITPVIGYVRVSRVGDRGGDSFLSPELQRAELERVAQRDGLRLVRVIEELDASGGDNSRPGWNEAIQAVESGAVKGLAVWNLARFSRSSKDALVALDRIESAGGRVYSATEQWDDSTPEGVFARNLFINHAELERGRARVGFARAKESAIARAIFVSGTIPFGYTRGPTRRLVPDPEKAALVRAIFEKRAKGASMGQLVRFAAEQGHQITRGGVRNMLANPTYLGQVRPGNLVNNEAHPPIIGQALFDKAQKARGQRPIHTGIYETDVLLRGLVKCGTCGHRTVIHNAKKSKSTYDRAYYCRYEHCEAHASILASALDDLVAG